MRLKSFVQAPTEQRQQYVAELLQKSKKSTSKRRRGAQPVPAQIVAEAKKRLSAYARQTTANKG